MHEFLIVPAGESASFTGSYCGGIKALEPRALTDGRSVLPERLLLEPDAMTAFPGLAQLAIQEVSEEQFL